MSAVQPSMIVRQELAAMPTRAGVVLDAVVAGLGALDGVEVVAIAGSVAQGRADRWSDLDLQCGVADRTAATADLVRKVVHGCLDVGDERWVVPQRILSVAGVDWTRLDVTILDLDAPFAPDAVVLHNPGGVDVVRGSPPVFIADGARLIAQVTRFLRSVGLMVRDLQRGDLRLGCWAVEFLVNELIDLLFQANGLVRGAQKGTYARLPVADTELLQTLPTAIPERASIIAAHLAVADAYLDRARTLAAAWGAEWPAAMEAATRRFLSDELAIAW